MLFLLVLTVLQWTAKYILNKNITDMTAFLSFEKKTKQRPGFVCKEVPEHITRHAFTLSPFIKCL